MKVAALATYITTYQMLTTNTPVSLRSDYKCAQCGDVVDGWFRHEAIRGGKTSNFFHAYEVFITRSPCSRRRPSCQPPIEIRRTIHHAGLDMNLFIPSAVFRRCSHAASDEIPVGKRRIEGADSLFPPIEQHHTASIVRKGLSCR